MRLWVPLAAFLFPGALAAPPNARNAEVHTAKGNFLVHMLHSAYFFPNTANIKWTATAKGRPDLPLWLHLFPSRHRGIAYLIGTPVTPLSQVIIHVIARNKDTFERADQFITITLTDDVRYNSTTQQIVEFRLRDIEAEEFVNHRSDQLKRLERTIHETFRGRGVNPYIFNIVPEFVPNPDQPLPQRSFKSGSIVQIGTQSSFHPNVMNLVRGLHNNPDYCTQNNIIPLNKHFRGVFDVNWCQFAVRNVTLVKGFISASTTSQPFIQPNESIITEKKNTEEKGYDFPDSHFYWESFVIFPAMAVLLVLLLLCLCFIFCGRREGQQWRDYRTPKEQLTEYLNVRESQKHLRELSVQRQMLLMSADRSKSNTPVGIHSFLQPRSKIIGGSQPRLAPSSPTRIRVERRANSTLPENGSHERFPLINTNGRSSIGKQTVAEAALATGSSLNLYRNPLDEEENDFQ